jgi:hypothetical protein
MLSHLVKSVFAGKDGRADKGVRIAGWIAASLPGFIPGPKKLAAFLALLAPEPFISKEIQSILILREHGDRRYGTGMLKGFLRAAAKRGFGREKISEKTGKRNRERRYEWPYQSAIIFASSPL